MVLHQKLSSVRGPIPARVDVSQRPSNKPRSKLKSISVSKRIFETVAIPFWVFDFGNRTIASFDYQPENFGLLDGTTVVGPTIQRQLPFTQGLNQLFVNLSDGMSFGLFTGTIPTVRRRLDSSTNTAVIRDVTIAFDPAVDSFPNLAQASRSYGQSLNALLAGKLIFFAQPFETAYSIANAIKVSGGSPSYWSSTAATDGQLLLSPRLNGTHQRGGGTIEVFIPPAGRVKIGLEIPSISINGAAYVLNGTPVMYAWSALLTGTLEISSNLGSVPGPDFYGDDPRCKPGFDIGIMAGGATSLRAIFTHGEEWLKARLGPAMQCPPHLGLNIPIVPAGLAPLSNLR